MGVFVINAKNSELLDVFSLVNQKYIALRDPEERIICRYWRTGISTEVPKVDLLREGVLKLKISNVSDYWITLSNLVLSVNGMTIYYDDNHVSSSAQATIFSQTYAETSFTDEPLKEGMSKSLIVRSQKRLPVIREVCYGVGSSMSFLDTVIYGDVTIRSILVFLVLMTATVIFAKLITLVLKRALIDKLKKNVLDIILKVVYYTIIIAVFVGLTPLLGINLSGLLLAGVSQG